MIGLPIRNSIQLGEFIGLASRERTFARPSGKSNEQIAVFGARFARDFFTRIEWRKCFGKISGCSTVPHCVPGSMHPPVESVYV